MLTSCYFSNVMISLQLNLGDVAGAQGGLLARSARQAMEEGGLNRVSMAVGETKTRSAVTWLPCRLCWSGRGHGCPWWNCGGALAETPACLPAYNCGGQLGAFSLVLSLLVATPPFQGAGQCGVHTLRDPPAHPPEMGKVIIPGYTRMFV